MLLINFVSVVKKLKYECVLFLYNVQNRIWSLLLVIAELCMQTTSTFRDSVVNTRVRTVIHIKILIVGNRNNIKTTCNMVKILYL